MEWKRAEAALCRGEVLRVMFILSENAVVKLNRYNDGFIRKIPIFFCK